MRKSTSCFLTLTFFFLLWISDIGEQRHEIHLHYVDNIGGIANEIPKYSSSFSIWGKGLVSTIRESCLKPKLFKAPDRLTVGALPKAHMLFFIYFMLCLLGLAYFIMVSLICRSFLVILSLLRKIFPKQTLNQILWSFSDLEDT